MGSAHRSSVEEVGGAGAFLAPVAFRPDGNRLARGGGGSDYTWRSWNVSSLQGQILSSELMVNDEVEKEVLTCKGHTVHSFSPLSYKGPIFSVLFSHDGRWAPGLTSSLDCTSRIWEATTGAWVCTLIGHTAFVGASDFSPIGHYLLTGAQDCDLSGHDLEIP
jgi:WD40 repeat protein